MELVLYEQQSSDAGMHPSALEIRRRVQQRRQARLNDAALIVAQGANGDVVARTTNADEYKLPPADRLFVTAKLKAEDLFFRRADHQLVIHKAIRSLGNDVARSTSLSKQKLDVLSDLEGRIQQLRRGLQNPYANLRHAAAEVEDDLRKDPKAIMLHYITTCPRCDRKILRKLLPDHQKNCSVLRARSSQAAGATDDDATAHLKAAMKEMYLLPPQAPRNRRVGEVTAASIELLWEPPIVDGGLPVIQYQVRYRYRPPADSSATGSSTTPPNTGRLEASPEISTSQWCLMEPIADHGFTLHNFRGDTQYFNFEVRCQNAKGFSAWATIAEQVRTKEVTEPTSPLHILPTKVTSCSITFSWRAPNSDGGAPIRSYFVHYTVLLKKVATEAGARSRGELEAKSFKVSTESAACGVCIEDLPTDVDVYGVQIFAMNSEGKLSAQPATYGTTIRMLPPNRQQLLEAELQRVLNLPYEYVNSDFYNGHIVRELRADLIQRLQQDLEVEQKAQAAATPQTESPIGQLPVRSHAYHQYVEIVEVRRRHTTEVDDELLEADELAEYDGLTRLRRKQFLARIRHLEETIDATDDKIRGLHASRGATIRMLRSLQDRIAELLAELDRVANFQGKDINSSVIHGANQRFTISELRKELYRAIERCRAEIANTKRQAIRNEEERKKLVVDKQKYIDALQERRQAFALFEEKRKGAEEAIKRIRDQTSELTRRYYGKWREFIAARKAFKATLSRMVTLIQRIPVKQALMRWSQRELTQQVEKKKQWEHLAGRGSVLVEIAKNKLDEVQRDASEALADVTRLKQSMSLATLTMSQRQRLVQSSYFNLTEEGLDVRKLEASRLYFLWQGDGLVAMGKIERAAELYEAQIVILRSSTELNIKALALTHNRLGKLFLRRERFERSIIEFDRQMSLANEIDDEAERAHAFLGLGEGYIGLCTYDIATMYLEKAYTTFEKISHQRNASEALRLLYECQRAAFQEEQAAVYKKQYDAVCNEIPNKLSTVGAALEEFRVRLMDVTVEVAHEVHLERISKRCVTLQQQIEAHFDSIDELEEEAELQAEDVDNLIALQKKIGEELDEARMSTEQQMWSSLLHDEVQLFDIEELKLRLEQKGRENAQKIEEKKRRYGDLQMKQQNHRDDIEALEQELQVEKGSLMRHVMQKKTFRCIAFDPANVASGEVSGTNSGGYEKFVASESNNVHVFDIHTGSVLHIFDGCNATNVDPTLKEGHTGVITALYLEGGRVYSGSVDTTIQVYSVERGKWLMEITGHEASVVCLCVHGDILVSGSADTTIRLMNKRNGHALKTLTGHVRAVTCLQMGVSWMVSGGADGDIRIWALKSRKSQQQSPQVACKMVLTAETGITAIAYGGLEVVTGDQKGELLLWWLESGEVIRRVKAHSGVVRCLQFDATRIVSGGQDQLIQIIDTTSGDILQTIRGHSGAILALAFDNSTILSAAADDRAIYWRWGSTSQAQDRYHVLDVGDTIFTLSKQFSVPVADLMRWNGITDPKDLYVGARVLVARAHPDQLTQAEERLRVRERERRQNKNVQLLDPESEQLLKPYDKIERIAAGSTMDASFAGRVFGAAAEQNSLFPQQIADRHSLAGRIRSNGAVQDARVTGPANAEPYFFAEDLIDHWGPIADKLALTMLDMFVSYVSYELVFDTTRRELVPASLAARTSKQTTQQSPRSINPKQLRRMKRQRRRQHLDAERKREQEAVPEETKP